MVSKFLAKSNGETILEHTNNLINNFKLLIKLYPNIKVDKRLLLLACIYHDLGKINTKFQSKLIQKKEEGIEIPHGILSTAFINVKELLNNNFTEEDTKILSYSVALHHERNTLEIENEDLKEEIKNMKNNYEIFKSELKQLEDKYFEIIKEKHFFLIFPQEIKKISNKYYSLNNRLYSKNLFNKKENTEEIFNKYIILKGILNKIDYASSSYLNIEEKNDFLNNDLEKFLKNILNKNEWNDLQNFMIQNRNKNVIVVAQTGYGKTEAGLLWIGNNKGFFTLPIRVAINSIYNRITKNIIKENYENKIGLLHSDFKEFYINNFQEEKENNLLEYIDKTRQFSLPLTICTIDQLFDFVFKYPGFELKVATLSYSKVVIDEIQMYSPELIAYLIYGIKFITNFDGKFAIMTATLPKIIPYLLEQENVDFISTTPFINNQKRHNLKILEEKINIEFIKEKYKNNKILVVCNTIKKAKEIYENLNIPIQEKNLIHSRFIKMDRIKKEKEILKFANPKRNKKEKNYGIWIGTQVIESSLDLDFDILITELSDLNGLFQRMGRCYRNREINNFQSNCFVFTKECSGIKGKNPIIDKEIHLKSKNVISKIVGVISEEKKLKLINEVYSYESLKDTKYFEKIIDNINYLKNYNIEYGKSKSEVKKEFRNIFSYDVIPKNIFENNKKEIESYIKILKSKIISSNDKIDKIKARSNLENFKVTIPDFEYRKIKKENIKKIKINNYENLTIIKCDYSYEKGIEI